MTCRVWIGEDSRKLFLEDLRKKVVDLREYGQTYEDRENQNQIRILEGMLPYDGWISKFQGEFELKDGVWVHKEGRGHFVIGRKVLKTSVFTDEDGKKYRFSSGTHVDINNHPAYIPEGLYLSSSRGLEREYHLHTKSREQQMIEQGKTPPERVELTGPDIYGIVWQIFQTYVDPFLLNPRSAPRSPPLLLYELVA